jgi:Domain of unknown function (DUF4440)
MFPGRPGAIVCGLDTFEDLLASWIGAEARGDVAALDGLLDDDFRGDGPGGFVLTKRAWLERHRSGEPAHDAFGWEDTRVRVHDTAAVATGTIRAHPTRDRGRDCGGCFVATLVAVRRNHRWAIVNVQLSPVADPSGATDPSATATP